MIFITLNSIHKAIQSDSIPDGRKPYCEENTGHPEKKMPRVTD